MRRAFDKFYLSLTDVENKKCKEVNFGGEQTLSKIVVFHLGQSFLLLPIENRMFHQLVSDEGNSGGFEM